MPKLTKITFVVCLLNLAGFVFLLRSAVTPEFKIAEAGIDYKDFISIMMTAVTVVLAAVGLIVALAAIWGYNALREAAENAATAAAALKAEEVAKSVAEKIVADIGSMAAREAQNAVMRSGALEEDRTEDLSKALAKGSE